MRFRARLRARAAAAVARIEQLDRERLLDAVRDLGERQVRDELDVGAGARRLPAPAEEIAQAAEPPEVAHEDVERIGEIDVRPTAARRTPQSRLAVPVVQSRACRDRGARRTPR